MNDKAAIITESSGKSVEFSEQSGIFTCLFEHEIKATKADFKWSGPKITKAQWDEMLAFFKWTYSEHKSEAQVRMFVHPQHGWKIWAFPQKGGTGMTTKEVETPEFAAQRAAIGEGYVQWGTVHHHCSSGSFQSSVDTNDEKSVEGIHITVGWMDKPIHDIHCRMYIKSHKFEPNMSHFWDVGDEVKEKLALVVSLGFKIDELMDKSARKQMTTTSPVEATFPAAWKENYIMPAPVITHWQGHGSYQGGGTIATSQGGGTTGLFWCHHCNVRNDNHASKDCPNKKKGKKEKIISMTGVNGLDYLDRKAVDELEKEAMLLNFTITEIEQCLIELTSEKCELYQLIIKVCGDEFITAEKLMDNWQKIAVEEAEESEKLKKEQLLLDNAEQSAGDGEAQKLADAREQAIREYYGGYGYGDY